MEFRCVSVVDQLILLDFGENSVGKLTTWQMKKWLGLLLCTQKR